MKTPYYLIDKSKLVRNLEKIQFVRQRSGAKVLLALKCFATWSVFDLMRAYMDGTTSSSPYEARLGREKFGGEVHAYSVAYDDDEIEDVATCADKVIFNSVAQLKKYGNRIGQRSLGLRLNPRVGWSPFDLADPTRPCSRLGEWDAEKIAAAAGLVDGFMIHNNCENDDFLRFDHLLHEVEIRFAPLLKAVEWVSLGGGISFTDDSYPVKAFCDRLEGFAHRYGVQVYLEPGEATVVGSTTLEVTVLDIVENRGLIAVVDSSIEGHMLDLLVYRQKARIEPNNGPHRYRVCGRSCLAGDTFGEFSFPRALQVGDRLSIEDAAAYTMVKKNWFNGLRMPSIAVRELDGRVEVARTFGFEDYVTSLS